MKRALLIVAALLVSAVMGFTSTAAVAIPDTDHTGHTYGVLRNFDDNDYVTYTYKFHNPGSVTLYETRIAPNRNTSASHDVIRFLIPRCFKADIDNGQGFRYIQYGGTAYPGVWIYVSPNDSIATVYNIWPYC